jgi:hypothetical protein
VGTSSVADPDLADFHSGSRGPGSYFIRKGMRVFKIALSAFLISLTGQNLLLIENYVLNLYLYILSNFV